jgi:hypothetical protein
MLGCFSLLLLLAEMKDLRLTKLGEILIKFYDCLRPFPSQMTVQGSDAEGFEGLSDNLISYTFRAWAFSCKNHG